MNLFINVGDLVGLLAVGVLLIFLVLAQTKRAIRQAFCKHSDGVNETRACEAICRKCGKNLGFIGTWRKQHDR